MSDESLSRSRDEPPARPYGLSDCLHELVAGYRDDGEGGVVGYGGALDIRPPSLTMRLERIHCV
ncbi:MAG: hypothetical protein OXT68_07045 [Chloroflexota bacterium]|nr:hypothetical protein [Chloroflexota bacterium]MDE2950507.1 hypothetical protein [Chloroflexota bacterium]